MNEFFKYLDAQTKYILPRIDSKVNRVFFLHGISKVKEVYQETPWHMSQITGFKFEYPDCFYLTGNPEKYFDKALKVGQELYITLRKKGFDV